MQEFRPADVIEQDTQLATSLADGDLEALDVLVRRYGRAVGAIVASDAEELDGSVAVFESVWHHRSDIEPGVEFAPWIGGLAARSVDRPIVDVEATWAVAMAIDAAPGDVRPALRVHHVEGRALADDVDRHELRLRRRLAHVGDDGALDAALADPAPWTDPPADLADRVRARVAPVRAAASLERDDVAAEADEVVGAVAEPPSRVTRALRPVVLGLAGAATVIFVSVIALSAASGSPDPIAFTADLIPTGAILDVEGGELTVIERDAGLEIELEAPTLPRRAGDQYYEGILVLQDGSEVSAGTFNVGIDVTLTAGVALDRTEVFRVVARELATDDVVVVLKLDIPRR